MPPLSDKLTPLILAALTRAAAEPAGVPLFASKAEPGLFPNTALGKTAAKRCLDESLLRRSDATGKAVESTAVTEKGLTHLLASASPKAVLEDLVRVLEQRRRQVDELLTQARSMAENLKGLNATLALVMPKVTFARMEVPHDIDLPGEILAALAEWSSGAGQDCPLPELHRRLESKPSPGTFHDALRKLHREGRVYLHPWTAPLYTIPDPAFALLVGHEVAYYASISSPPGFAGGEGRVRGDLAQKNQSQLLQT